MMTCKTSWRSASRCSSGLRPRPMKNRPQRGQKSTGEYLTYTCVCVCVWMYIDMCVCARVRERETPQGEEEPGARARSPPPPPTHTHTCIPADAQQ